MALHHGLTTSYITMYDALFDSYDCSYNWWYTIYSLYMITIFNTIMPQIPKCFYGYKSGHRNRLRTW